MREIVVGSTLANYEILGALGRGGMGVVYKAHEQSLQRVVALKVLPPHLAASDEFVQRFLQEARAAAQLSHPNIVVTHAVGEADGHYYIAMEYVKGETLWDLLRRASPLDIQRALRIVGQVAQALHVAHSHGILHRDIKPHNIMIDKTGLVRVMDFGLAYVGKDSTRLTATGTLLGTPMYMAPEQCQGETPGPESDIYSLGVTLYEMLAGQVPFPGDSPLAIMHQITSAPLVPVTAHNSAIPSPVVSLLEKMMNRDRGLRYRDARALAHDIKHLLDRAGLDTAPAMRGDIHVGTVPRAGNGADNKPTRAPGMGLNPASYLDLDRPVMQYAKVDRKPVNFQGLAFGVMLVTIAFLIVGGLFPLLKHGVRWRSSTGGWIDLLQDSSLGNWDNPKAPGNLGEWHMSDGVLCNRKDFQGRVEFFALDIETNDSYKDFELEYDYKITPTTNSGVFLRGLVEIQILGDGLARGIETVQRDGAIYGIYAPLDTPENSAGAWNSMRVRYVGDRISAWRNGVLIHDERVVERPSNEALLGANVHGAGPILIQNHTGAVWFRTMRIRRL